MRRIYLACPYSHPDAEVRENRVELANQVAAEIMQDGYIVFSPLSHSHGIAHYIGNHMEHDFWLKQCLAFIPWCDELWIMQLPGWKESSGIKMEVEVAGKKNKNIKYISLPQQEAYYAPTDQPLYLVASETRMET